MHQQSFVNHSCEYSKLDKKISLSPLTSRLDSKVHMQFEAGQHCQLTEIPFPNWNLRPKENTVKLVPKHTLQMYEKLAWQYTPNGMRNLGMKFCCLLQYTIMAITCVMNIYQININQSLQSKTDYGSLLIKLNVTVGSFKVFLGGSLVCVRYLRLGSTTTTLWFDIFHHLVNKLITV